MLFFFKIRQKKKREEQQARLLKLFEEDDDLEVELGIRDWDYIFSFYNTVRFSRGASTAIFLKIVFISFSLSQQTKLSLCMCIVEDDLKILFLS